MFGSKKDKEDAEFMRKHGMTRAAFETLQSINEEKKEEEQETSRSANPHRDFLDWVNENDSQIVVNDESLSADDAETEMLFRAEKRAIEHKKQSSNSADLVKDDDNIPTSKPIAAKMEPLPPKTKPNIPKTKPNVPKNNQNVIISDQADSTTVGGVIKAAPKFCCQCGTKLGVNVNFCSECGFRITNQ